MKIHVMDLDERQYTDKENYPDNHGPFSEIAIQINKALKVIDCYAEPDNADFVGICDGLNIGFKYKNKKSFVINVWETSNTIPNYLLDKGVGQLIFGLSNQISNLWRKYGFNVNTIYPGCDTNFWRQVCPKNDVFTFLHINSSNVRSGLDLTLEAFFLAFKNNKNVKLIVKDTNNSVQLKNKIDFLVTSGANIEYISERMSSTQIRYLYSKSHVCLNVIRITSFGLPLLECSACNCLCLTGDVPPTNEIINNENGVLLESCGELKFEDKIPYLTSEWGLLNCFPNFTYPEPPKLFDFNIYDYSEKLKLIYTKWDFFSKIDSRTHIVNNWSWQKSAKQLINYLHNAI